MVTTSTTSTQPWLPLVLHPHSLAYNQYYINTLMDNPSTTTTQFWVTPVLQPHSHGLPQNFIQTFLDTTSITSTQPSVHLVLQLHIARYNLYCMDTFLGATSTTSTQPWLPPVLPPHNPGTTSTTSTQSWLPPVLHSHSLGYQYAYQYGIHTSTATRCVSTELSFVWQCFFNCIIYLIGKRTVSFLITNKFVKIRIYQIRKISHFRI